MPKTLFREPGTLRVSRSKARNQGRQATPKLSKTWILGVASSVLSALLVAWATGLLQMVWTGLQFGGSVAVTVISLPVGVSAPPSSAPPPPETLDGPIGPTLRTDRVEKFESYNFVAFPGKLDARTLPERDFSEWARSHGGFRPFSSKVRLIIEGKGAKRTVLTGIKVSVLKRSAPIKASLVRTCPACTGGAVTPRTFRLDLDNSEPHLTGDVDFPFAVSETDTEVFDITATTKTCDCTWNFQLSMVTAGKTRTMTIGGDGKPFRTTAISADVACFAKGAREICLPV
ncbi:MAG: hypothetical protein ABW022_02415 [Actinoplanes sp.]